MSTSLAEQLRKYQLPQTSQLTQDKKKPSLLFDPKEAATLKRDTVYQIGIDGLDELVSKNPIFEEFRHSLFDATSKEVARSIQSKEFNEKLDSQIRRFLLLLSPYFPLKSSHKALEWLIHRYGIHEYNRDDVLMLILPYHETNIFVRVLQLLKIKDNKDNFFFLKGLQKPGLHLTKQALLNHACSDPSFLKFVGDFVMSVVKVHEKPAQLMVVFNYYCSVFTGTIQYSEKLTESQVSQILPCLLKGLNSNIPDFCAASYIILSVLTLKTELSDKLLNKFVLKLSQFKVESLRTESILLLIILYQHQKHYTNLPLEALQNFVEQEWLPKILQDLNAKGNYIYSFLEPMIKSVIEAVALSNEETFKEFFKSLLNTLALDHFFIGSLIRIILESMKVKADEKKSYHHWLTEVIQIVERQYPDQFDKELFKIMSSGEEPSMLQQKKFLKTLLKESVDSRSKFEIFEKLHHPNPHVRTEAIKLAASEFNKLKEADREFIKSSFIDRLYDDNVEVVRDALDVVTTLQIVSVADLKNHLRLLALKCEKVPELRKLSGHVLKVLCSMSNNNDWDILAIILSFFSSHSMKQIVKFLDGIAHSPFVTKNCLFNINLLKEQTSNEQLLTVFIKSLNDNTNYSVLHELIKFINVTPYCKTESFFKYLMLFLVTNILPKNCKIEVSSSVVELLFEWFNSLSDSIDSTHALGANLDTVDRKIKFFLDYAKNGKFHVEAFLVCVETVFLKTDVPDCNLKSLDFSKSNSTVDFFVMVCNILFNCHGRHKAYVDSLLKKFFQDPIDGVEFILNMSISGNAKFDANFQQNATKLVTSIVSKQNTYEIISNHDSYIVPYLLVLLSSEKEDVRKSSMNFVKRIRSNDAFGPYGAFLNGLYQHKEEITLDQEQMPLIMFNLLPVENVKNDSKHTLNKLVDICCEEKTPIYLQSGLLNLFSFINCIEMFEKISTLTLKILSKNEKEFSRHESSIVEKSILHLDSIVAEHLCLKSNPWDLIENLLRNDTSEINSGDNKLFPSVLVLDQIDKDLFVQFKADVQVKLLDVLIEVTTVTQNPMTLPAVNKIFKHIDLDAKQITDHLVKMRDAQSPKVDTSRRKRLASVLPTADILDTLEWRKGVTVLEFIQDKKKIRNVEVLLPLLFDILKKCLDFDEQVASIEYVKQLLLSSILNCYAKLEDQNLSESVFNMELVVQCIRASPNPQTHHHALLVLAETANLFPNQVLHHIMAIFTFMGSSVLRYDDSYSFQMLTKIIDEIIPILVGDNDMAKIGQVLRVFVDAILDVPEHRRIPLYKMLLTRIQAQEHLYLFLLLVFESHVAHSSNEKNKKGGDTPRVLDIATNLCHEFTPDVVMHSCIKLIAYLKSLPEEKDTYMETNAETVTFNVQKRTPKVFRHYKYTLILFVANLLSSKEFVNQVAQMSDADILNIESLYRDMIINILTYIQRASKTAEKYAKTPQMQYWKVIVHHSYDILDSVNALLTPEMFLLVAKGLMVHNLGMVRKRALELLNIKLQHNSTFFSNCENKEIFAIVPPLISIIKTIDDEVDTDQEIIIQTALLSLKLLVRLLAKENASEFKNILDFIVNVLKSGKARDNVLASVILCLAEMCYNLGVYAISTLPEYMPAVLKLLKQQKQQDSSSLLLLSVLSALHKIFEKLALFMNPYLVKILREVSLLMSKYGVDIDNQKTDPIALKLLSIKQKIGSTIPPRTLIPAVEECYISLSEKSCFNSIGSLMDILSECLANLKGPDITAHLPELTNFFLTALQLRADDRSSMQESSSVEKHVIEALTTLVLKLSESSFRPLYYKLYDWAIRNEVKTERVITFYNLSREISENLQGLFVLFAGHFINHAAQILDACNKVKSEELYFNSEEKNLLLLENVLKTLWNVFKYDGQKFTNKDRFDTLMQPIVDQLENTLGGEDMLQKRCGDSLIPCIAAFASAVGDDSLWKQLNYQILLKMRHNTPTIRLVALGCVTEVVKKLGDDFLPLLPETIPFLAELLEDEEEQVEKACQKAVQEMEKVLGESLQKYF